MLDKLIPLIAPLIIILTSCPVEAPKAVKTDKKEWKIVLQKEVAPLKIQKPEVRIVVAKDKISAVKPILTAEAPQQRGYQYCLKHFDSANCRALVELINRESGWQVGIKNRYSGACGLGQSLPCSKMGSAYGSFEGELSWTIQYIKERYKNPLIALAFHNRHNYY